jgi:CubicO group peptidase (beta-lactamase class C family)
MLTSSPCKLLGAMLRICGALAFYIGSAAVVSIPSASAAPLTACKTDLTLQLRILNVPGLAAAIVKDGKVVCTAAVGMANIEEKSPVTQDTLFLVASISKTITATALMQLYEQGKFQLDDDVNVYLPFKVRIPNAPTSPITFRQLLTHTSSIRDNEAYINCARWCGYGSSINSFVTRGTDSPISLANFTMGYLTLGGAYYDQSENFESSAPGTVNAYSNMGIVLAGFLVEMISGAPFDKYCKDRIFTPLAMHKTSWRLAETDQTILAIPYNRSSSGYVSHGQYGEADYPDGMLRTSVVELAHFLIAYIRGGLYDGQKILKSTTVQEMLKRQTSLDSDQGLVWYKETIEGKTVWGHEGSDHGASAIMWFDPENDAGVILMANGHWDHEEPLLVSLFHEADGY